MLAKVGLSAAKRARKWRSKCGTSSRRVRKGGIVSGRRIGVDYAGEYRDMPWRYYIKDSPFVSVRADKEN